MPSPALTKKTVLNPELVERVVYNGAITATGATTSWTLSNLNSDADTLLIQVCCKDGTSVTVTAADINGMSMQIDSARGGYGNRSICILRFTGAVPKNATVNLTTSGTPTTAPTARVIDVYGAKLRLIEGAEWAHSIINQSTKAMTGMTPSMLKEAKVLFVFMNEYGAINITGTDGCEILYETSDATYVGVDCMYHILPRIPTDDNVYDITFNTTTFGTISGVVYKTDGA